MSTQETRNLSLQGVIEDSMQRFGRVKFLVHGFEPYLVHHAVEEAITELGARSAELLDIVMRETRLNPDAIDALALKYTSKPRPTDETLETGDGILAGEIILEEIRQFYPEIVQADNERVAPFSKPVI